MGSNAPRDDLESTFIFSCGINGCCGSDISYPLCVLLKRWPRRTDVKREKKKFASFVVLRSLEFMLDRGKRSDK